MPWGCFGEKAKGKKATGKKATSDEQYPAANPSSQTFILIDNSHGSQWVHRRLQSPIATDGNKPDPRSMEREEEKKKKAKSDRTAGKSSNGHRDDSNGGKRNGIPKRSPTFAK